MAKKRVSDVTEQSEDSSPPKSKRARRDASDALSVEEDGSKGSHREHSVEEDEEMQEEEEPELEVDSEEERIYEEKRRQSQAQGNRGKEGAIAECGILEKIELTNFMNHRLLTIVLGPQLNFIVGHNGTGKSAILTSIVLGLGGSAANTDRGKSLSTFIKDQEDKAIIHIRLKNQGADAFKPDLYGKSIIVERTITKSSSTFKLKSASGQTISNKRDELREMLDHLHIQIDNPMAILMQEKAKSFLQASTPKEFYTQFLKGTQLAQLATEYDAILQTIKKAKVDLQRTEKEIPRLREAREEAKARFNRIQALQKHQDRQSALSDMLAWSWVKAVEDSLEEAFAKLEAAKVKIPEIEQKIAHEEAQRDETDAKVVQVEERLHEHQESRQGDTARLDELKQKIASTKAEVKDINKDIRAIDGDIKEERSKLVGINKMIKDKQREYEKKHKGSREDKQKAIDELTEEHERLSPQAMAARKAVIEHEHSLQENRPAFVDAKEKVEQAQQELQRAREGLQQAQNRSSNNNPLAAYHPNMQRALADIDKARWDRKPVGPVGRYVKLRDQSWGTVLEAVFRGGLNSFVVSTQSDKAKLLKILREHKMDDIIVWKTKPTQHLDITSGLPDASLTTILSKLTIEDPVIRNALIDNHRIESSILEETQEEATAIMRSVPANVTNCYTRQGFRITGGTVGSGQVAMSRWQGVPRLTADLSGYIADRQNDVQAAHDALKAAEAELGTIDRSMRIATDGKRKADHTARDLSSRLMDLDNKRQVLEAQLHDDAPLDIQDLIEQRDECNQAIEHHQNQFKAVNEQMNAKLAETKPWVQEKEAIEAQGEVHSAKTKDFQKELSELARAKVSVDGRIRHWTDSLRKRNELVTEAQADHAALHTKLQQNTDRAAEVCPERPEGELRDSKHYINELTAIEKAIREAQRREGGMTPEQIQAAMIEADEIYKSAQKSFQQCGRFIAALENAHKLRIDRWAHFLRYFGLRIRLAFAAKLARRNFGGSMHFDHRQQLLEMRVITDQNAAVKVKKDDASRGTKSLSGGEKSFSTVSMLLAMWEVIASPLRCLDEYDVFMDAFNRRIATGFIVEAGKEADGRQHILISPNSVHSKFYSLPYVRVIKMQDNKRGNGEQGVIETQ